MFKTKGSKFIAVFLSVIMAAGLVMPFSASAESESENSRQNQAQGHRGRRNSFHKRFRREDIAYGHRGERYIKNQILITAYDDVSFEEIEELSKNINAEIVGFIEITNDYQIELRKSSSIDFLNQLIGDLINNPLIEFASLNTVFKIKYDGEYFSNDIEIQPINGEVKIHEKNWNLYAINAYQAWGFYFGFKPRPPAKIGLIDTFFYPHDDEDLNFFATWNTESLYEKVASEENNHGMHVAGIMAAGFNNEEGIAGVCPENLLYGYANWGVNDFNEDNSTMEFKYAIASLVSSGVKVINISMATDENLELNTQSMGDFINKLLHKNYDFIIVTSAGNEAKNAKKNSFLTNIDITPAKDHIIVVGAIEHKKEENRRNSPFIKDSNGNMVLKYDFWITEERNDSGSNWGDRVDIVAPGERVYSTVKAGVGDAKSSYDYKTGTSMAAPHVSGVAGMIYSLKPNLPGNLVKQAILEGARNSAKLDVDRVVGKTIGNQTYSYFILDAKAALEVALSFPDIYQEELENGIIMGSITNGDGNLFRSGTAVVNAYEYVNNEWTSLASEYPDESYGHYELILDIDKTKSIKLEYNALGCKTIEKYVDLSPKEVIYMGNIALTPADNNGSEDPNNNNNDFVVIIEDEEIWQGYGVYMEWTHTSNDTVWLNQRYSSSHGVVTQLPNGGLYYEIIFWCDVRWTNLSTGESFFVESGVPYTYYSVPEDCISFPNFKIAGDWRWNSDGTPYNKS
ncbi:MAG: S8/S53 family peptidase [Oscillospiraceae bacterium]|nr:S8/S53 family peptidase [Oscillospiraceae bacterium]